MILSQARAITPVNTGALRRSLTYGDIKRIGETYNMIIGSSLSYFDSVENGHYQEVGRYVPAIGKKLKKGFVQGKHMISQSVEIYQEEINTNIIKELTNRLERYRQQGIEVSVIPIGKQVEEEMRKAGYPVEVSRQHLIDKPTYAAMAPLADLLADNAY